LVIKYLAINCLALSALPSPYYWLVVLEVDLCNDVMSCCGLIAQLTIDSVE
jgi:hypothetical protein